ncbi:MAG: hypothetical protein LBS43_00850, partial [Prevotellaceae bacterium]|nr:hypothetical protein [Prevotellaceae bacterium]
MVRSPRFSFIQFDAAVQACCTALPVAELSDLAFYAYADFKYLIGIKTSSGLIVKDASGTLYDWFGSCVDGADVDIDLSAVLQCGECFNLVLLDGNIVKSTSNTFQYLCNDEYTSVVKYLLNGAGFEWDCPACLNSVRLPLHLTEPQYPQEQEVYKLKGGYRRHLFAEIEKTYTLKTDFLPDELHQKLVIALSHDEVYIDDLLLTKSESYNIDWGNIETIGGVKYAMATAGMVENVTQRNDNCGECSIEGDTCSYEWLDIDAVCQLSDETVQFSEYVCQERRWQQLLMPSVGYWRSITFGVVNGKNRFVGVMYAENKAAFSDDGGVTWTETALPPSILYSTSIAHGIVNGNMRFVVVSG